MRLLFANDVAIDLDKPVFSLLKLVDRDANAVRHLVAEEAQRLFADNLGDHKAHAAVGVEVFGIVPLPFGQQLFQHVRDLVNALAFERRDWHDRVNALDVFIL